MKITFAYATEVDGKSYKPDQTADIDNQTARRLLREGRARTADNGAEKKG